MRGTTLVHSCECNLILITGGPDTFYYNSKCSSSVSKMVLSQVSHQTTCLLTKQPSISLSLELSTLYLTQLKTSRLSCNSLNTYH